MTQDEKEYFLAVAKGIVQQAEPQSDTSILENTRADALEKAKNSSLMREEYMLVVGSLTDIIESRREGLQGLRDIVIYIERTPANELTREDILTRISKYAHPKQR